MPVVRQSNNKIIPSNNRAADVAKKAIEEITPVQQAKSMAAFYVQGYQGVLYTKMRNGMNCSCQSSRKVLNTILDKDGKASEGTINALITGSDFGIERYGADAWSHEDKSSPDIITITSPKNHNKHRGTFDLATKGDVYPDERIVEKGYGDNGPVQEFDLDAIIGDFDMTTLGITDASCPVCFGTGFVGGYQPMFSHREVLVPENVMVPNDGEIITDSMPFRCESSGFEASVIFPRGMTDIDAFRLYDKNKPLNYRFTIDGKEGTLPNLKAAFDGKPHQLVVSFDRQQWTHFEMQFYTSKGNQGYFEFPRLTNSNDVSLLEQTEPFQIILSPNIPHVYTEDIFVDSTLGKVLIVQSTPTWHTRNRRVLGWECQVRATQPQEIYSLLPRRGRVPLKNRTTVTQRDNVRGPYRT